MLQILFAFCISIGKSIYLIFRIMQKACTKFNLLRSIFFIQQHSDAKIHNTTALRKVFDRIRCIFLTFSNLFGFSQRIKKDHGDVAIHTLIGHNAITNESGAHEIYINDHYITFCVLTFQRNFYVSDPEQFCNT